MSELMFSVMIQNLRNRQHMFGTTVMFLIGAIFIWSLFNMMWWALYTHAILLFFAIFTFGIYGLPLVLPFLTLLIFVPTAKKGKYTRVINLLRIFAIIIGISAVLYFWMNAYSGGAKEPWYYTDEGG